MVVDLDTFPIYQNIDFKNIEVSEIDSHSGITLATKFERIGNSFLIQKNSGAFMRTFKISYNEPPQGYEVGPVYWRTDSPFSLQHIHLVLMGFSPETDFNLESLKALAEVPVDDSAKPRDLLVQYQRLRVFAQQIVSNPHSDVGPTHLEVEVAFRFLQVARALGNVFLMYPGEKDVTRVRDWLYQLPQLNGGIDAIDGARIAANNKRARAAAAIQITEQIDAMEGNQLRQVWQNETKIDCKQENIAHAIFYNKFSAYVDDFGSSSAELYDQLRLTPEAVLADQNACVAAIAQDALAAMARSDLSALQQDHFAGLVLDQANRSQDRAASGPRFVADANFLRTIAGVFQAPR